MSEPIDRFAEPVVKTGTCYQFLLRGHTTPVYFDVIDGEDKAFVATEAVVLTFANGEIVHVSKSHIMILRKTPFTREVRPKAKPTPRASVWRDEDDTPASHTA